MARRIPGLRPFLPAEARMAPRKFTAVDFFELRTKNKQTFGYANKWLYFFFAGCKLLLIVRAALLRQALGRKTPQRW